MTTMNKHSDGRFCWNQIVTTDVDGAITFYSALFGWEVEEEELLAGNQMVRLTHEGEFVLGINLLGQGNSKPDASPTVNITEETISPEETASPEEPSGVVISTSSGAHWEPYMAMSDLAGTLQKATALGGKILEDLTPEEDFGTMAEIQSPSGTRLSMWAAGTFGGHSLTNKNCRPGWYSLQLLAKEDDQDFWPALTNWTAVTNDSGFTIFKTDENTEICDSTVLSRKEGEILCIHSSRWLTYIQVADIEATCRDAEAIEGKVLIGPSDSPTGRRHAVIMDPQGGHFGIISPA
jgi:predicted enzyme related to lactoylglutathione lyase